MTAQVLRIKNIPMPYLVAVIPAFRLTKWVVDHIGCAYLYVIGDCGLMRPGRRSMGSLVGRTEGRSDSVSSG